LIAQGLSLTAAQRSEIFATASVETITDQSGTYTAPAGLVSLTTGNDTIVTPSSGETVYATAATLNAGDSLTGGAGTDVLTLVGSGTFRVDQLANFTGFERIQIDNAAVSFANLTLGSQPIELDATGYLEIFVDSSSNWNSSNIINGDPTHSLYLQFSNQSSTGLNYDLTSNTLSHVYCIVGTGDNLSLTVNSSDLAGVQLFNGYGSNDQLVTGSSTLDLSHTSVIGFRIVSSNGVGTTFTVADVGTAFQVEGGAGHDTLDAHSLALTAGQRTAIFGTSSIETIIDQTGTYTAPAGTVRLTSGNDTIVTPPSGATVYATAATLNAGDSLTGGAGTDVLELVGNGTFRVDQLATFTGFERIETDNTVLSFANLTLGSQPIEVDATGYLEIFVDSPSNWNNSNIVNGDPSRSLYLQFSNQTYTSLNYDLTSNMLSHVYDVVGTGDNLSFTVNNSDLAAVQLFTGYGQNDQLVTGSSALDLSHTSVTGFRVVSTNGLGTTFTVGDLGTALQVDGGPGHDTLIAQGLTLTAAQRTEIFVTSSIETIVDQSGTYAAGQTVIESFGSTSLTEIGNNFYLYTAGSGPELKYGGAPWTAGQWGGWTPIGAEATATGYEVALKFGSADLYTVWSTDAHGNITTDLIGSVSGSSLTLQALETSFHQDLNNDGVTGLPPGDTLIETFGSTSLVQTGSNFVFDKAGGGPELHYDGSAFTAGQWGGWTPIGVEATATGYEVAFNLTGTDQYTVWDTDANGNITIDPTGTVSGESPTLIALEKSFQQDLNGDGMIGNPAIPITVESFGSTSLVLTGNDYFLDPKGTSNGPELKYGGTAWTDGEWGGWTPIAAEVTATGHEVAFNLAGTNQYTVWNTDAAGNITSDTIGTVTGNSAALEGLETSFHQDLNGDGIIGDPSVPYAVETSGSTSLTQLGHDFFLYANGTSNGPELKYSGAPWTAGVWGGWTPIGAEATAGGYEVAFRLTGADLYAVWNTDSNGNITTNAIGSVPGSDASLQSIETSFQQDLNGDGVIGPPSHTSAASGDSSTAGSATITNASSGFQLSFTSIDAANTFSITIATPPIIASGSGNAVLSGTADSDTFVFNAHFGNDTVTGFQPGVDQVDLDHTLFASVADLLAHTADNAAGSAVVGVDANQSITFDHVSTLALQQHASDLHLV
jgi:hypothetical protein